MVIWLMRHGIAVSRDDPDCPADPERPLTAKGRSRTEAAARGLHRLDVRPELILSSHLRRAIETAEIAADVLGYPRDRIVRTDALDIDAAPEELFRFLGERGESQILCCGHAPNLDWTLSSCLDDLDGIGALKKCGTACLDLPDGPGHPGKLLWNHPPRELRRLGEEEPSQP